MKLNEKGQALYDKWEAIYFEENDRLGGNSAAGDFVEGWSIIDNTDFVKTITDECGLFIFGYETDAVWMVNEFLREYGNETWYPFNFTAEEFKQELLKYFETK